MYIVYIHLLTVTIFHKIWVTALNCSSWCPGSIEVSVNDKNLNHSFDHSVYLPRGWRRTRGVHIWCQDWYEMSPGTDLYTVWRNKTAWSPTSTSWNTRLTSRSNHGHTRSELETKQVSSELCVWHITPKSLINILCQLLTLTYHSIQYKAYSGQYYN